MFKVCISLIFLLYIINSRINFTEAQTLVKQRQSPDYYALAVENNQNRCLVSNIVIFNHTQRLNLFDITPVTPSSLEISAVSTANISQQIFLLNGSYNVQYTTLEFKVNNLPYHASNSYHCFDQANIDGFNLLLKATSYYNPPDFSLIFPFSIQIPLYVSPYQMTVPLNCSSPPYECQVFPLGTASNEYYAQLKKLPYGTYVYNETIPVTISNFWNSNQNFVIDVDNKFPVETASDPPSNIKIFRQYPDSNTIVKMDSLLQPKRIVILFTTTEPYHKTLVYEQIIFGTNLAPSTWNLVKSNGSETTYLITSPLYSSSNWNNYSIYTIVDNTIKQLYKFTNITYEIPSFSPQLSSAVNYVGGVSVQQTLSSMLPWYVNGVVKLPVTELTFEFPFGYINFNPGTNDYYWDISIYYPINSKGDALSKYCMSSDACLDTTETFTPLPAYDQTNFSSIEINSMTVKPLNSYSYLVAINITSYFRIIQLDYCGWIIRSSDLVSGSANNGVYEKLIQLSLDQTFSLAPYLKVYDETSIGKEMITFKEFQINSKGDTIPLLPSSIYPFIQFTSVNSFRSFKFQFNNIDISGGYFTNMLEIVFNVVDNPSFIPILVIGDKDLIDRDYQTKNLQFYGVYNPNTKSHQIRFEIPPQFTSGDMIYYLVTPYRVFNNSILSGFLGESATLKISKSQGDMLVPRLFYINSITANKVPIVTNATIGWELTIDENPNGFKNGIVTVLSTYDLEPRIFLINESNLVSGDKYAGIYRFNITISIAECRDKMQLYISNMELFDDGDVLLNPNIYPPLSFVYNTNPIELSCASKPYTQSPFIKSLEITPSVDVGSPSRYVQINMTVQDGSGGYQISPRHNPYVYLISYPDSVKIPLEAAEGNATNVRYTANFKLPYGMGNGDHFYLSVYGIMDRYYQINGYPTDMLRTTSLPYSINRTFTLNQDPTLQSYSPFVSDIDTVISVYGFSLGSPGTTLSAEINYGTRYQSLVINTRSETLISINVTSFRALGIQSAKIRVLLRGNIYSNEIVLIPQKYIGPTPTTTPTQTPSLPTTCNPKCSDHGVCQNQQCICSGRWVGPTCSSEIIPISPPLPEPKPSTNVQVENKINITVGIIQINELDTDLSIVNSFDLRNITWSFKDLSTTKDIIYFYSTKLPGREETTINTTLQFFKDETFIKFGSKNITMLPSSIKFTSSLSKFNFGTKQNLLDVIFEASILSNDQGSCSSQLSGNITDGQYIKININEYSLYGSFIDTIILDGRETLANNIIQNDKSSHQSSFIQVAVRIPQYEETVIIDPNFSALVDIEDEGTSKLCKPKKKLSNGAIAGIVVGCIVFISIIIIPIIIYKRKVYYGIKLKMISLKKTNK